MLAYSFNVDIVSRCTRAALHGTLLGLQSWTPEKRKSISLRWIMDGTSTIQYHCCLVLCVLVFAQSFNISHCFTDRLIHYSLQVRVQHVSGDVSRNGFPIS